MHRNLYPGGRSGESIKTGSISTKRREKFLADQLFLAVVVLMGFGLWLVAGRNAVDTTGSTLGNVLWAITYVIALAGLSKQRYYAATTLRRSLPLVFVVGLAVASTAWSEQHAATARRGFELVGTSAIALYLVRRLHLRGFVNALSLTLIATALISLFLVVFIPEVGFDSNFDDSVWAGFFNSKNHLGQAMDLGMVTLLCTASGKTQLTRFFQAVAFLLFLGLLVGSRNGSGAYTFIFLAVLIPLLLVSRARRTMKPAIFGIALIAIIILGATIAGFGIDDALALFGKDSTLTGRTSVWDLVISAISQKPILGYGYGAFWGQDAPAEALVYSSLNWRPGSAHNGLLEIPLNLGIVGLGLVFITVLTGFKRAFITFWHNTDLYSAWPLFVMLYTVLINVSDATLISYNLVDWIAYLAAYFVATEQEAKARNVPSTT